MVSRALSAEISAPFIAGVLLCAWAVTVMWDYMLKNVVFSDWPNNSSNDEEDYDDVDEDEDEGVEDSRNDPSTQTRPQTPNNSRSRNMYRDKHKVALGRMANTNPKTGKDEAIKILAINRDCSIRKVNIDHRTLAIKYRPDE